MSYYRYILIRTVDKAMYGASLSLRKNGSVDKLKKKHLLYGIIHISDIGGAFYDGKN